jgi:hypothetical protein
MELLFTEKVGQWLACCATAQPVDVLQALVVAQKCIAVRDQP